MTANGNEILGNIIHSKKSVKNQAEKVCLRYSTIFTRKFLLF